MGHSRKQIRSAVVSMLLNNTTAGSNVYSNRETNLWESELPCILVYTTEETSSRRDLSGRQSVRTLQLRVEIKAQADEMVDDTLDDLATEVEDIISLDHSLVGTSLSTILNSTDITLDSSSDTEKGVMVLNYEVKYIE